MKLNKYSLSKSILILFLVTLDTLTKKYAISLGLAVFNRGISFGLLDFVNKIWWIIGSILIIILLSVWCNRMKLDKVGELGMILIISGGISNTISRILYNGVPDWINLDLFGLVSFPVFNLADLMIDLSIGLLIISLLRKNFEFSSSEQNN